MKITNSIKLAFMGVFLMLSPHALAYTIDDGGVSVDVGVADTIIASTTLASSGEATETAWVESALGFSVSFTDKIEDTFSWSLATGETDVFAHLLTSDPQYFLVKIGTGNSGDDTHYLFDNADSLSYAVFDLGALGIDPDTATFNFSAISHIAEFAAVVPEATTLTLLGLGLFGLGFVSRRK